MKNFGSAAERVAQNTFLLAVLSIPLATALTSIFASLTYIAFLAALCAQKELRQTLRFLPAILALSLFGLFLIGSVWSIAPHDELIQGIRKYTKLLLLPIGIALTWRDSRMAKRAVIYFLASSGIAAFCSYLLRFGLIPPGAFTFGPIGDPSNAFVFKNHITMGILLAFSALACFNHAFHARTMPVRLLAAGLGIFYAIPILFFIYGRTGYISMFIGAVAICLLRFRSRHKALALGMVAIVASFAIIYETSSAFKLRTDLLVSEATANVHTLSFKTGNSTGIRLGFYLGGLQIMAQHPVLGLGTGAYAEGISAFAKRTAPPDDPLRTERHQPHSEVILIGVQLGALGLLIYLFLMASLVRIARNAECQEADLLVMLCAIFFIASLFNSLLWDFTEGHWFALMAGCLYAAARRAKDHAEGSDASPLAGGRRGMKSLQAV